MASLEKPLRVLLVTPLSSNSTLCIADLGLGFLATAARDAGAVVDMLDCTRDGLDMAGFEARVREFNPDVLGIKAFSINVSSVNAMSQTVRRILPDVQIIVGGPHPSASPDTVLDELPQVDFAFRGEGERAFVQWLSCVADNRLEPDDLKDIPGLIYRLQDSSAANEPDIDVDISKIGMPAWDLLQPEKYMRFEPMWSFPKTQGPAAPINLVRGCPFKCRYCAMHIITHHNVRMRNIDSVIQELLLLRDRHDVTEFHIVDDFFTQKRDYALAFCRALKQARVNLPWCMPIGARIDSFDAELLHALEDAGCYGVALGLESGSDRVLDFMRKRLTAEEIETSMALLRRETSWWVHGFFLMGIPTETREEMIQTIEFARKLPLHSATFSTFRLYKGTWFYNYVMEHEAHLIDPVYGIEKGYAPEGMTVRDMQRMRLYAYWRFFSTPGRIFKALSCIHSWRSLCFTCTKIRQRMLPAKELTF